MTGATLESVAGASSDAVRAFLGGDVASVASLSGLRPAWAARAVARIRLADGRTVKLRRMRRAADAARVEALLVEVDDARFPRVLFRHARVLVEPWTDGRPLDDASVGASQAQELGDALSMLHARRSALGVALPYVASTAGWRASVSGYLADLRVAGRVSEASVRRVEALMSRLDPLVAEQGLIHGDLCAENAVLAAGGVVVVDNEGLAVGALDGDVGRTLARWRMDESTRDAFARGYGARRDATSAFRDERFWRLGAVVKSLHLRELRLGVDSSAPRAQLDELVEASFRPPGGARSPTADRS